ncbi:uncharacterized protein [Prorops nasuta]|uniref:uncharacterized protein n=1 Tax=Prorops nasuta TaxID=863751 RepID=UPI0034CE522E
MCLNNRIYVCTDMVVIIETGEDNRRQHQSSDAYQSRETCRSRLARRKMSPSTPLGRNESQGSTMQKLQDSNVERSLSLIALSSFSISLYPSHILATSLLLLYTLIG